MVNTAGAAQERKSRYPDGWSVLLVRYVGDPEQPSWWTKMESGCLAFASLRPYPDGLYVHIFVRRAQCQQIGLQMNVVAAALILIDLSEAFPCATEALRL